MASMILCILIDIFRASVYVQLGAKFDEVRKAVTIIGVETFNSTKKRMAICFRVRFLDCTTTFEGLQVFCNLLC